MIPRQRQRVVVTGVGSLSALGMGGFAAVGEALEAGRPALAPLRALPVEGTASRLAGELPAEVLEGLTAPEEARRLSRVCQLTVAVCRLALRDAAWDGASVGPGPGLGVIVGTEFGDLRSTQDFADGFLHRGPAGLPALIFPNTVMNIMATTTAIAVGAKGPSITLNQPTVAGDLAIGRAAAMVANGRLSAALAGGVDEIYPLLYRMLSALGGLSPMGSGPEGCRPFDRSRNGPVRGEGATFVLLESLDRALRRGATIYAEIRGADWGNSPARPHRPPRPGDGAGAVIVRALAQAGLDREAIGWAYLSGAGDPRLDDWELELLRAAFGPHRPRLTSLTPLAGDHAGLGGLRVAGAAWTARTRRLPPLTSLKEPVRADYAFATGREPWAAKGAGLVHGVARGGTQVALIVAPFETSSS